MTANPPKTATWMRLSPQCSRRWEYFTPSPPIRAVLSMRPCSLGLLVMKRAMRCCRWRPDTLPDLYPSFRRPWTSNWQRQVPSLDIGTEIAAFGCNGTCTKQFLVGAGCLPPRLGRSLGVYHSDIT